MTQQRPAPFDGKCTWDTYHAQFELLADLNRWSNTEKLVRLPYPEAAESMVEVLAKDQFVDALPDKDMHLHIRQNKPTTLRDACQLLAKFSDVFSDGPHDLGCTDLVKYHIDTGSSNLSDSLLENSPGSRERMQRNAYRKCKNKVSLNHLQVHGHLQ